MSFRRFNRRDCLLQALLISLGAFVCAQLVFGYGGVYTQTEHGDTSNGVARDSNLPTGNCNQCHVQHGLTPDEYDFALFAANTNALCYTSGCHDSASTLQIYQGQTVYNAATHATDSSVVWPTAPPVRAAGTGDSGKCVNCHNPHGYKDGTGLVSSMAWRREEILCQDCHDGTPAPDVYSEVTETSSHPVTTYSGRHAASEDGTAANFGTANRHAECVDCHNPHQAKADTPAPTAPNASNRIKGVSRVSVGTGANPRTFTYKGPGNTTSVKEYEVCYKCHSGWTTLPVGTTDKAAELNPANPAHHAVEDHGKNHSTVDSGHGTGAGPDSRVFVSPYTEDSVIYCVDCHASDNTSINGPHGSAYSPIIKKAYTRGGSDPPATELCFDCHVSAQYLTNTDGSDTTYTHFRDTTDTTGRNLHYYHVGQRNNSCDLCHPSIHGSSVTHMVELNVDQGGTYTHTATGGSCTMARHAHKRGEPYSWR